MAIMVSIGYHYTCAINHSTSLINPWFWFIFGHQPLLLTNVMPFATSTTLVVSVNPGHETPPDIAWLRAEFQGKLLRGFLPSRALKTILGDDKDGKWCSWLYNDDWWSLIITFELLGMIADNSKEYNSEWCLMMTLNETTTITTTMFTMMVIAIIAGRVFICTRMCILLHICMWFNDIDVWIRANTHTHVMRIMCMKMTMTIVALTIMIMMIVNVKSITMVIMTTMMMFMMVVIIDVVVMVSIIIVLAIVRRCNARNINTETHWRWRLSPAYFMRLSMW